MTPPQLPHRWVITGLCLLLLALGLLTFLGERGILHIWRLAEDKRKLDEINFLLQQENQALHRKIQRLRQDDLYLEKVAREELGLARPGEIVYRFAPPQSSKNSNSPPPSATSPEPRRSSAQKQRR